MYEVRPFLLYPIKIGTILQNNISTTVISNENLISFLQNLEENRTIELSEEYLKSNFCDKSDKIKDFLLENKIIQPIVEKIINLKNICVISNDEIFTNVSKMFMNDLDIYKKIDYINTYNNDFENINKDTLAIIFFNPFNLKEFETIIDKLKNKKCTIKSIFYYNHSIYISNYYNFVWKNPCPKCFFYSLEAQLRGFNRRKDSINFQTLIDLFYTKQINFNLEFISKSYHFIPIIDIIFKDLRFLNNFNDFANTVYEISVEGISESADIAYHWEMCNCYE
ncbi:MAG: McbB family protein [Defluviitaleaceae bacterium]|nr:McbB family protein [Defluviitaleaceae bacterium]